MKLIPSHSFYSFVEVELDKQPEIETQLKLQDIELDFFDELSSTINLRRAKYWQESKSF